jgi:oxaloacetate decarboxylase alpha subunit
MTTAQMLPVLETLDQAGYYSLECWGGATFDVCLRYLHEDPWKRLRTIRSHVKKTKLQMLLRGQNLLGYTNFPDDIVEKFIEKSIKNGIDIIRIFDALNDTRNLEISFRAIKKFGGHAQAAICYTTSPFHNIEYFVKLAKTLESMGADSLSIKDMAGILTPRNAYDLVKEIKAATHIPLNLHTHNTSGSGSMTLLKAVEAGCDIIDTAISPLSDGTSQPPTETMKIALEEQGYSTGLNQAKLNEISGHFNDVRHDFEARKAVNLKVYEVTPAILQSQIPGGMLSNLLAQLRESGAEDRIDEVMAEVEKVRSEVGYPPLVTPMSQIVGAQAVANVISGQRYMIVPNEMRDYVKGLYGRPPAPVSEELVKNILQGDSPITCRPADLLQPGFKKVKSQLGRWGKSDEDVLSYALFPEPSQEFFKKRLTATLLMVL